MCNLRGLQVVFYLDRISMGVTGFLCFCSACLLTEFPLNLVARHSFDGLMELEWLLQIWQCGIREVLDQML